MYFIDSTRNPYNYYLQSLKNSIKSIVGDNKEMCEKVLRKRIDAFEQENRDLPSVDIEPNNPQRLVRFACYVSEYVFKSILATSLTDDYGKFVLTPAFGVEYYTYDFEGEFTTTQKPYTQNTIDGYYITSRNKLWDKIKFQPNSRETLTKPDVFENYNVIDFNELTNRLKSDIRNYYYKNPDLKTNLNPDKNLQQIFGKVLGELSASLMKGQKRSSNYGL